MRPTAQPTIRARRSPPAGERPARARPARARAAAGARRCRAALPALALVVLALAPGVLSAQDDGIAVGALVEPFTIQDMEGGEVDLAEVIGRKPVLVVFWATWCPVCRVLDPRLATAREKFGDRVEFLVVAVGVGQRPEQIATHIRRHPVAGRLLYDARGAAARAFEAPGTGYVVILGEDGRVAWTGTGPDQDFEAALRQLTADR